MSTAANRKERLSTVSSILTNNPSRLYSLSYFSEMFGSAKSTLSEDIAIIRETFQKYGLGDIEVLMGAGGGIRYLPSLRKDEKRAVIEEIVQKLKNPSRILPGGFLYTADIFYNPVYVGKLAKMLWDFFSKTAPDFIITVEAKGIPLAMSVARLFERPLVVARRKNKVTEGSVVTINYMSGSSRRMQTMSLAKRAVQEGQKTLIIDDFIAGGGTVHALFEMMKEFSIVVVGCGAAISTKVPNKKRIENYKSLMVLQEINEEQQKIQVISNV